jgi:membrane-associated phospholipid phosphatase
MMGAGGSFAAFVFVFGFAALPLLLILILIGWARIKLECHNLNQVLAGAVLASISTYLQIQFIVNYFGNT